MTLPSLHRPRPKNEEPGDRLPAPWLSHAHSALARATRRLRRNPKRVPPIPTRRLRDVEGHCSGRPDERDLRDARDDFIDLARPSSFPRTRLGSQSSLKSGSPLRPDVLNHDPSVPQSPPSASACPTPALRAHLARDSFELRSSVHLAERQNAGLATDVFRSAFANSKLDDSIIEINPVLIP